MTAECKCDNLRSLISVEYPGIVKNVGKALDTLNGIKTIESVLNSPKDRLELIFRKQDPYAHPAHGDRLPARSLLIKFKRRRKKPSQEDDSTSKLTYDYEVEVIGKIQTVFKFDTLAEFQWLPMTRTNFSGTTIDPARINEEFRISRSEESLKPKYTSIMEELIPSDPFDGTLRTLNPDAPLLILPAVFSRFDTPNDNVHVPQPKFRNQEMREEYERQNRLSIIGKTRKKRSTLACLISWNDPVPEEAPEKVINYYNQLPEFEKKMIPRVEACFSRQPIWSRAALCFELGCTVIEIRYILPIVAFHYTNGPFRTMWVKYNYNPTKEKSSKIYQTLDFRFKRAYCNRADSANIYAKRSIYQYQLPKKKGEKSRRTTHTDLRSSLINNQSLQHAITYRETNLETNNSLVTSTNTDNEGSQTGTINNRLEDSLDYNTTDDLSNAQLVTITGDGEFHPEEGILVSQNTDSQIYEEVIEANSSGDRDNGNGPTGIVDQPPNIANLVVTDTSEPTASLPANISMEIEVERSQEHDQGQQQQADEDVSDSDLMNEESIDFGYTSLQKEFVKESMFKFREDLLPAYRQLSYQLKDIELNEVQMLVHENDGQEPEACSEKDGWCSPGTIDRIRRIMTARIDSLLNEMNGLGGDNTITDTTNNLEPCSSTQIQ